MTLDDPNSEPPVPPTRQLPARPRYGEYAPGGVPPVVPAQPPEAAVASAHSHSTIAPQGYVPLAPGRKRRTADVVVTSILLAFGLIGALVGISVPLSLSSALAATFARYNTHYTEPANLGTLGAIIAISHAILIVVALGVAIPLMVKRRIAFWVPLVTGILAAIVFWGILGSLLVGNQSFMDAVNRGGVG
jgi:hypothetical protein